MVSKNNVLTTKVQEITPAQ